VRSDLNLDTSVRICIAIKDKDISAERDKQPFDRLLVSVGFDEDDGRDYDMVDETNERTNEGPGDRPPGCSSDRADEDGAEYLDGLFRRLLSLNPSRSSPTADTTAKQVRGSNALWTRLGISSSINEPLWVLRLPY
jgi:hypothetical protein